MHQLIGMLALAHAQEPSEHVDEATLLAALEDVEAESETQQLRLYGFADTTFRLPLWPQDASWAAFAGPAPTFMVSNLNLYLESQLSSRWASLTEVRFLYNPNGSFDNLREGSFAQTDTLTLDVLENRPLRWGGIEIERAWVQYEASQLLQVRVGQWLTPYGIWNIDHGSPTIIGVVRPWIIGEELLPERQTGIQVHGQGRIGGHRLSYAATVSNGRGRLSAFRDLDANKALGARVAWEHGVERRIKIGLSTYGGRMSVLSYSFQGSGTGFDISSTLDRRYDELSFAADLLFETRRLRLQAEVATNERRWDDTARAVADLSVSQESFEADGVEHGVYLLAAYRLPWAGLRPYAIYSYWHPNQAVVGTTSFYRFGLNVRPVPRVVLKVEGNFTRFADAESPPYDEPFSMLLTQIAWAF
ncbi:MAG: hypothetical protein AAF602_26930 [Myxococcota bacterium]